MYPFLQSGLKLIKNYKSLIKKKLPREEYRKNLANLKLDVPLPRDAVSVYHLLNSVFNHLKDQVNPKFENARFSGTLMFLKDIKNLLDEYRLEKDQLVHVAQEVSSSMVMAVQLMVLPMEKRTKKIETELDMHALKIAQHAENEEKLFFLRSLKNILKQDLFFEPFFMRYQEYLQKHANPYLLTQLTDQG